MENQVGLVEATFQKLFTRRCEVARVEAFDRFRLVELHGRALDGVAWSPGQKVELFLGGWAKRTYTPLALSNGSLQLLAYVPDSGGPGAAWARSVAAGDACAVFGPRDSVRLDSLLRPGLLFGDETSIGLAHALRHTAEGRRVVHVALEVSSIAGTRPVLDRLELDGVHLVQRTPADAHLQSLCAWIESRARDEGLAGGVLSGKASSIQRVKRGLQAIGLRGAQVRTRAYWAAGKRGLD